MKDFEDFGLFDDGEDDEDITPMDFGDWLAVFWDGMQQGRLRIGLFTSQPAPDVPVTFVDFIETLDIPPADEVK